MIMKYQILVPVAVLMMTLLTFGCSDPCKNKNCQNGGVCVEGECFCQDGYYGPNCEFREPCADINCLNGGYCEDGSCHCPPGYSGDRCQDRDNCYGVNCLNGGHCEDGDCVCPTGYTGSQCEVALTPMGVKITKVAVTQFPSRKQNGAQWDQGEVAEPQSWPPDLYVEVQKENIHLDYSYYTANCDPADDYNLYFDNPVLFTPITAKCIVRLYDYDHQQNEDDLIGG